MKIGKRSQQHYQKKFDNKPIHNEKNLKTKIKSYKRKKIL